MSRIISIAVLAVVCSITSASKADFIVYGTDTSSTLIPGATLADVCMSVDLTVANNLATMTFTNVSTGPETSAVLKQIVLDTVDNDTGQAILWNPTIIASSIGVGYSVVTSSNGLPGYEQYTKETPSLLEFDANPPPPKEGLGIGEYLQVQFNTSLANGSTLGDYFQAFGGGNDTSAYSIGFQAISSSIVNGNSLSGIITTNESGQGQVPEPCTLTLLAIGTSMLLFRRMRRPSAKVSL